MALNSTRSLAELLAECDALDIDLWWGPSKSDCIAALRDYYIEDLYGKQKPLWLKYSLFLDSPYLCKKFGDVPETAIKSLMEDPATIVDEKIDGCRLFLYFIRNKDGYGDIEFHATGRNNSVKTFMPIEYGHKILLGNNRPLDDAFDPRNIGCILDCEVVSTKSNVQVTDKSAKTQTQLQSTAALLSSDSDISYNAQKSSPLKFVVFDCIFSDAVWLNNSPIEFRRHKAEQYVGALSAVGLRIEMVNSKTGLTKAQKYEFFNDITANGGEGIVLKRAKSVYNEEGRRTNDWVKMKRTMSGSIGDTTDMFVNGYEYGTEGKSRENQIASLKLYMYVDDIKRHVATVCNFTDAEREEITANYTEKYLGRVCEVDAQDVSSKNMLFMHAKFIRWRDDKDQCSCTISKDNLLKYVL